MAMTCDGGSIEVLAGLAIVLWGIVPHSAEPERLFSLMGWYSSSRRCRSGVQTMAMMAAVKMHYDQQAAPAVPQPSKPVHPDEQERIALAAAAAMLPAAERSAAAAAAATARLAECGEDGGDLLDASPEQLGQLLQELQAADLAEMAAAAGTAGGMTFTELLRAPWTGVNLDAPQLDPDFEGSTGAGPLLGLLGGDGSAGGTSDFDPEQLVLQTMGNA